VVWAYSKRIRLLTPLSRRRSPLDRQKALAYALKEKGLLFTLTAFIAEFFTENLA
jgi:hypothetical protein